MLLRFRELPQTFPEQAPIIRFLTSVSHPWLDSACVVVGYEKLRNWGTHTSLKNVVNELVVQFSQNPPRGAAPYVIVTRVCVYAVVSTRFLTAESARR